KTEQSAQQIKIDKDGNVLKEKEEKHGHTCAYRETVLEKKAGAKKAARLKRHYDKAVVTSDGELQTLPYEGKTVLIEQKGWRDALRVEGGREIKGPDAKFLDEEFNKKKAGGGDFEKLLLPGKAVKVGESWKIDPALVNKGLQAGSGMELDPDKTSATAKMEQGYREDGRQIGAMTLGLEVTPGALKNAGQTVRVQPGAKMVLEMTLDACIDGSQAVGDGTLALTITAEALLPDPDQPMFTLTVN